MIEIYMSWLVHVVYRSDRNDSAHYNLNPSVRTLISDYYRSRIASDYKEVLYIKKNS